MIPEAIEIVSDVELRLRGRVIWAKSVGALGVWIEPFFFSVRLSDTDDLVAAYVFSFADAARGLEKVLYGMRLRRPDWFFPAEWLFTFQR